MTPRLFCLANKEFRESLSYRPAAIWSASNIKCIQMFRVLAQFIHALGKYTLCRKNERDGSIRHAASGNWAYMSAALHRLIQMDQPFSNRGRKRNLLRRTLAQMYSASSDAYSSGLLRTFFHHYQKISNETIN